MPTRCPINGDRRLRRSGALVSVLVAGIALALPAAADVSGSDRTMARALFEQARDLMAANHFVEACPKFAESYRLDPAAGTQLNLAVCHEGEGKTATAWSELNDALTQARRDGRTDREELARQHLATLERKLSRLTIQVTSAAQSQSLEIRLDQSVIGPASWGVAAPVDPGLHVVTATAPRRKPWREEVSVGAEGDRRIVSIPPLAEAPAQPKPDALPAAKPGDDGSRSHTAAASRAAPTPSVDSGTMRWAVPAGVSFGLAALGLGVGAGTGAISLSKVSDIKSRCVGNQCLISDQGNADSAATLGTVSTVGFVVGGVAAAAGIVLVIARPGHGGPLTGDNVRVGVSAGRLTVEGSF